MQTKTQAITNYNKQRTFVERQLLCHAPVTTINFTQNGDMRACCYNNEELLGTYPYQTIHEAWESQNAQKLRQRMKGDSLGGGCERCMMLILAGNFTGTMASSFDRYATLNNRLRYKKLQPTVFEFELSNTCNLECIMCDGYFSSAIRANREGKPKLQNPYDEEFVKQVRTFIPGLKAAKFLGGEPFMIKQYYEIWEAIAEIKPDIEISITTNGTILNKRVRDTLAVLSNVHIIVSIDSMNRENYESIRVNADFDLVMFNLEWFREYTVQQKTSLTIAICPMVSNRMYISDVIRYCNINNAVICFNTVTEPKDQCLKYLPHSKIEELITDLKTIDYPNTHHGRENKVLANNFLSMLEEWSVIQKENEDKYKRYAIILSNIDTANLSSEEFIVFELIQSHYKMIFENLKQDSYDMNNLQDHLLGLDKILLVDIMFSLLFKILVNKNIQNIQSFLMDSEYKEEGVSYAADYFMRRISNESDFLRKFHEDFENITTDYLEVELKKLRKL